MSLTVLWITDVQEISFLDDLEKQGTGSLYTFTMRSILFTYKNSNLLELLKNEISIVYDYKTGFTWKRKCLTIIGRSFVKPLI